MQDNGSADYFLHGEPVGEKHQKRIAPIAEKRRKVAGMRRVRTVSGVIMDTGIGKGVLRVPGTRMSFMDMESENIGRTRALSLWKPLDLRDQQNSVRSLI